MTKQAVAFRCCFAKQPKNDHWDLRLLRIRCSGSHGKLHKRLSTAITVTIKCTQPAQEHEHKTAHHDTWFPVCRLLRRYTYHCLIRRPRPFSRHKQSDRTCALRRHCKPVFTQHILLDVTTSGHQLWTHISSNRRSLRRHHTAGRQRLSKRPDRWFMPAAACLSFSR